MSSPNLPGHLQRFFTDRLIGQLSASSHTIDSYRDTFQLLLKFAVEHRKCAASNMRVEDLDTKLVGAFLKHLEQDRKNTVRTRNNRFCAIRAFFGYVSLNDPALAANCQRVLAMPLKRFERGPVEFLKKEETTALLKAPDTRIWLGRRDRIMLEVAIQTGLRNSELRGLRRRDVQLGRGAHVRCLGKGRKHRSTPLRTDMATRLSVWFEELSDDPMMPVFPTAAGKPRLATSFSARFRFSISWPLVHASEVCRAHCAISRQSVVSSPGS